MADGPAFTARLTALGFAQPARAALNAQGLVTAADLCSLSKDDIDKMIAHVQSEVRNTPVDPANPRPIFPFVAVKNLKAFYHWIVYRDARGQALNPAQFVEPTITKWKTHLIELDRTAMDGEATKPEPLASFDDWVDWEERFLTYCRNKRSARTGVPISYLLRPHDDVTAEMLDATYDSIDDDLIATMILSGGDMAHDNHQLYDTLKGLLQAGAAAPFMAPHNRSRNGRLAYLAVKAQAEGQSALSSRKANAYAMIATARYTGKSRFTFDAYVARHQKAHNELFLLEEPVPENKKVTDFLAGIEDSSFTTFKGVIIGDHDKFNNFEVCQQYLKSCSTTLQATQSVVNKRNVAVATTSRTNRKGNKNNKGSSNGPSEPPHYGHYTNEEYRALNAEQRLKLKQHRDKNGKGKSGGKRRAAAAVETNVATETDDEIPKRKAKKVRISDDAKKHDSGTPITSNTTSKYWEGVKTPYPKVDPKYIDVIMDVKKLGNRWPYFDPKHQEADWHITAKKHANIEVFEEDEDPVWLFHQPNKTDWLAKLKATYKRRLCLEDEDWNSQFRTAVGMTKKEFDKIVADGLENYVNHVYHQNNDKKVRCGNYTCSSPYYSWNQARVEEEIRLKTEQDAQAQFGRASTSTMKGEKKNDSNV